MKISLADKNLLFELGNYRLMSFLFSFFVFVLIVLVETGGTGETVFKEL